MSNHCQQLAAQLCHCRTAWFCATGCEMNTKVNCAHSLLLSGWVMSLGLERWVRSFLGKEKLQKLEGLVGSALPRWGRHCCEEMKYGCRFSPRVKVTLLWRDKWLPALGRAVDCWPTLLLVIGADRTPLHPATRSWVFKRPTIHGFKMRADVISLSKRDDHHMTSDLSTPRHRFRFIIGILSLPSSSSSSAF